MPKRIFIGLAIIVSMVAMSGLARAQTSRPITESDNTSQPNLARELRLTRQLIEDLQRQLIRLEVAAIQIRLQQDVVVSKQSRLDSVKSETTLTEEALTEVRNRTKKLEAIDVSGFEEVEQQRLRQELDVAKKEVQREEQKVSLLRSRESELEGELQLEKARLSELIKQLQTFGELRTERTNNPPKTGEANGSPSREDNE